MHTGTHPQPSKMNRGCNLRTKQRLRHWRNRSAMARNAVHSLELYTPMAYTTNCRYNVQASDWSNRYHRTIPTQPINWNNNKLITCGHNNVFGQFYIVTTMQIITRQYSSKIILEGKDVQCFNNLTHIQVSSLECRKSLNIKTSIMMKSKCFHNSFTNHKEWTIKWAQKMDM